MRNTNRGESTSETIALIFALAVGFVVGICVGLYAKERQIYKSAVEANVAEWRVDKDGNTSLYWKAQPKATP